MKTSTMTHPENNIGDPDDNLAADSFKTAVTEHEERDEVDFHQFAKLPPEIQLMIWDFACYHSRTVPVWVTDKDTLKRAMTGDIRNRMAYRFATDSPALAIMQVCWESRLAAMKVYKRIFHTFADFCPILNYYKIANIAIDDVTSPRYTIWGRDSWRKFEGVPEWVGPHVKNTIQYTTLNDNIVDLTHPLNLVNYTKETSHPETFLELQRTNRDEKVFQLSLMLGSFDSY
ncbi:hypothetical protein SBOR_6748 [Sclerotinia borealis F-4128]|uniref:2EXR domain-containing protein n=1 Tax=Sclerotinia borealis (strain F-4128) TaxID=1432307 RepID=W9CEC8_SCLBF|nr:hypothetical protein SBOR_6748 [Sclerotinia borealis F-4128]